MGLDHVPVIFHFGPGSRAPKSFENTNPNEKGALLNFIASQSNSEINFEEAFKPPKDHSILVSAVTIAVILGGLMFAKILTPAMVFKNAYIWSIFIVVRT